MRTVKTVQTVEGFCFCCVSVNFVFTSSRDPGQGQTLPSVGGLVSDLYSRVYWPPFGVNEDFLKIGEDFD